MNAFMGALVNRRAKGTIVKEIPFLWNVKRNATLYKNICFFYYVSATYLFSSKLFYFTIIMVILERSGFYIRRSLFLYCCHSHVRLSVERYCKQ